MCIDGKGNLFVGICSKDGSFSEHCVDFKLVTTRKNGKKKWYRLKLLDNVAGNRFSRKNYRSSAEKMKGCLSVILYGCLVGERNQGSGIHVIFFFFCLYTENAKARTV